MFCPDFSAYPIVVVGDLMLDVYYRGEVNRISPEAPVPVVRVTGKNHTLGGAANVALNLAELGAPVTLIGLRGEDEPGQILANLLAVKGIVDSVVVDPAHVTTAKTRVVSGNQQIVRLDEEKTWQPSQALTERLIYKVTQATSKAKAVILSDYGKGLFSNELTQLLIRECKKAEIPVFVDPKGGDWSRYAGATCITPNSKEFLQVCKRSTSSDKEMQNEANRLVDELGIKWLLVTRGRRGMSLFSAGPKATHIATEAREVYDVSGAGDTVIATAAAAFAAGLPLPEAVSLANCAAGIVVQKNGTQPITKVELEAALRNRQASGANKLFTAGEAKKMIELWKSSGKRTVFTNGCFDLLHTGHIKLLHAAAAQGDKLVIGLNSDDSIKRLKGPQRPVLPQQERAALMGAIGCVDMVCIFSEDTPLELISLLKPDVLVKGGDYTPETVVGRDLVESYGGKVVIVPLKDGMSTTNIIDAVYQKRGVAN